MKERPILFSAPMVRAILEGRKTQTRRIVKSYRGHPVVNLAEAEPTLGYSGRHNDPDSWGYEFLDDGAPAPLSAWPELCPYGQPGDRMWVRETFFQMPHPAECGLTREAIPHTWDLACADAGRLIYRADRGAEIAIDGMRWKSSIHMPRWASRITLEVTGVHVERLLDISEEGAIAEGCKAVDGMKWHTFKEAAAGVPMHDHTAKDAFEALWDSINGEGSSDANPWVWAIEFKRVETSRG